MKTAFEQEYELVKAKFIELSKQVHLRYDTYEPEFQLAADAVRSVFNVEPIHHGTKRMTIESRATMALIGIMKSQTDINDSHLSKLLGGTKNNTSVYKNIQRHKEAYEKEPKYRQRYNQSLVNYIEKAV